MANTTNFNWATPDDTDLVKDGAAAIRTLGSSIDTSFVDLKGGTTGQVLSKASNTDLDYTWVTTDDANAIQNAIVDAKGDLIAASANDTPARLAVGNNGETLVADSSATTGLRWQGSMSAGRNFILNGGFDIWQRGTSVAVAASQTAYTTDRWKLSLGANASYTVSRQATGDTTNLPFVQYAARVQRDSGQTGTNIGYFIQGIETVNSIPLAGKSITFSFYARKGANYSAASDALSFSVAYGTGTDQDPAGAYTGQANAISTSVTLTSTWQRFTATATMATTATEIKAFFNYTPVGTAGANDYYEITGVQLEVGSVATQFSRAGATLAGELAACQRYFQRRIDSVATPEETVGVAQNYSTTQSFGSLNWINTMRVAPTVSVSAVTDYAIRNATAGVVTLTAFTFDRISTNQCRFNTTVAAGQVAGDAGLVAAIFANSATLDASAEL